MVFGTNNYWAMDSMQWNLNERRAVESKWATPAAPQAEPVDHQKVLFAAPRVRMQAQLDRERTH